MKASPYGQNPKKLQENAPQQKMNGEESVSSEGSASFFPPLSEGALMAILTPDGQLLECSNAFSETFLLGKLAKGTNFFDCLIAADRSLLARKFLLARHNKSEYLTQVTPLYGDHRQPVPLKIRVLQDRVLLEEVQAETGEKEVIKSSLTPSFSLLEKIPLAALVYSCQHQLLKANQHFLKFAGYKDFEELLPNHDELLFPQQPSAISELLFSVEKSKQEIKEANTFLCLSTKQGELKWVQLSMHYIPDGLEEGSPPVYLAFLQDVSALKEQESQLLKQQEEMDNFMDRAFHDLKGPINSLLALYQLLEHEFGQDKRVMEYVRHYHQGISRLHRVLHDLLILSRIKKAEPQLKNVCLQKMVEDCLQSFRNLPHFNHIRFIKDIRVQGEIVAEESLLQTIIQNLLENAIKYCSEEDPEVKIVASLENDYVNLQVSDNGIGIPEDLQQRVFERFFRATDKASGSGLGLYLLQQALLKLNGSVSLESREGEGTTFSVLIPLR